MGSGCRAGKLSGERGLGQGGRGEVALACLIDGDGSG